MKRMDSVSLWSGLVVALAGVSVCDTVRAQAAGVVLYGRINTGIERVDASRSAVDLSMTRLSNYRSVVGVRGAEDLGDGLKAVWQIEGGFSLDTGAGSLSNRDTRVGLQGPFGTLFLGVWTLPYTAATSDFDPFYPTTAGYMAIMGNGSAPTTDNVIDTSSFDRRQRNVIQYWSPTWGHVSGRAAYGFNEEDVNRARPSLLSGSVSYDDGALTMTGAVERHHEYEAPGTDDIGAKVGAAYRLGPARLAAVVERLKYQTATGSLKRNSWYVSGTYRIGAGSLRAGYARAGNGRGSAVETVGFFRSGADTGASQLTIGYEHELSKRTALFAFYSRIDNDAQALYDFAINELGVAPGARPRVISLGLRHAF